MFQRFGYSGPIPLQIYCKFFVMCIEILHFVSEWSVSRADGSGGVFTQESETWLNFLHQNGISWANWSLCDKNETSAALKPGTPTNRPWTGNDLTPSGKFVFSHF